MHIDLNIFKTNIVSDLQQMYSGGNTRNSAFSTISKANYKEKFFHVVNVYMLISKIQVSASHVLIINQRILFI